MKTFFCFLFMTSVSVGVNAQSATDSIKTAVNNLFTAMKTADTVLLKKCFSPNAVMHTIQNNKGVIKVVDETVTDFVGFVGKETVGAADEQIVFESIKIDGAMATVWTPYKFYYKGQFSHCGVNSFQLVRLAEGWKIQYIIDTRRKQGCE
jgi:hypothetical protein